MSISDLIEADQMNDSATLAPPPINFRREYFRIDGKTYRIDNENNQISFHVRPKFGVMYHNHDVGSTDVERMHLDCYGCLGILLLMWPVLLLIFLFCRKAISSIL